MRKWLAHPRTRGLDVDDPHTTELRRRIIREKGFLRQLYQEWYGAVAAALPPAGAPALELGSGAGFLKEFVPGLITSDLFCGSGLDVLLDASALPFADGSLRGIVLIDVLHHVPEPRRFFAEAARCVRPEGVVVMIEPWVTPWSRWVYGRLHHEPFEPDAARWELTPGSPLSGANTALPHILFARDRDQFQREFPMWEIRTLKPIMPFRYLLSGGVSMRSLMPGNTYDFWRDLEALLGPWMDSLAMFAQIVLRRRAG